MLILGWFCVRVPCCRGCGWWLQLARSWAFGRTVVVGLGSMALAGYTLSAWFEGISLGLLSLGFTIVCLGALVSWEMMHPPGFTVEVHHATVEYKFRDQALAQEFARLNGGVLVEYGQMALSDQPNER